MFPKAAPEARRDFFKGKMGLGFVAKDERHGNNCIWQNVILTLCHFRTISVSVTAKGENRLLPNTVISKTSPKW
jgi:hypothetical protein